MLAPFLQDKLLPATLGLARPNTPFMHLLVNLLLQTYSCRLSRCTITSDLDTLV